MPPGATVRWARTLVLLASAFIALRTAHRAAELVVLDGGVRAAQPDQHDQVRQHRPPKAPGAARGGSARSSHRSRESIDFLDPPATERFLKPLSVSGALHQNGVFFRARFRAPGLENGPPERVLRKQHRCPRL